MVAKKSQIMISVLALGFLSVVVVWAAATTILKKDHFGTILGSSSSDNYTLQMSVGESITGPMINSNVILNSGLMNTNSRPTLVPSAIPVFIPDQTTTKVFNSRINPMKREKAVIRLHVHEETHVKMAIYTLRGQQIRKLSDGDYLPGEYYFEWDGCNLYKSVVGSGIYIVHIQYSNKEETRKIAVIK